MTYGQLFAFIKQEALSACQELKFQAKYGSERRELGSFCEAFGIKGIKAPSAQIKKNSLAYNKFRTRKPRYSRKSRYSNEDYYKKPNKNTYKNITCYKCGKKGHKANVCRNNKKSNEILDKFPELDKELKQKLSISLVQGDSSDDHHDDFQSFESSDEGNLSSPCNCKTINMIKYSDNTAKDQKELIFDIIQDLPPEAQKKQLEKFKALILKEESSSARLVEPFSISKMFERYPHMNPQIKQNHTKELQTEINLLKAQVKELKERVFSVETKNLELDTQIALIQSKITKGKEQISSTPRFSTTYIFNGHRNTYIQTSKLYPYFNLLKSKCILCLHSILDQTTFNSYLTVPVPPKVPQPQKHLLLRLHRQPNKIPPLQRSPLLTRQMTQLNFKNFSDSRHFNNNSNNNPVTVLHPRRIRLPNLPFSTSNKLASMNVGKVLGLTGKTVGKPVPIGCSRHSGPTVPIQNCSFMASIRSIARFNCLVSLRDFNCLMANLVRRMFSSGSSLDSKRVLQSKEEHILCNFNDWTIPEEQIETIYKVGTFDFKTAFSVKTHEETMNIQEKSQTIPLLSKVSLQKYAEKGFRYIHYGLIQVAVKPLVHIGVDAPVYLALRDKRLKRYKPSLLAMIQTNICNGPIYFNCAPNYSVSLTDPLIMNSLVLDIHMQGDEFEKLTEQFVVMYRVYYRLLSSQLNP
ncbi:hypothetical protein M9H77_02352 [Catharanthus roseus]|uniref:Uncharacterized protein n=1 Tax=Catharanthus roseus TaxID=4058 RepID=A0ACC0C853_CATRO|nr:hypothetical protein M9H77_02352 [Catharanthus roseus]